MKGKRKKIFLMNNTHLKKLKKKKKRTHEGHQKEQNKILEQSQTKFRPREISKPGAGFPEDKVNRSLDTQVKKKNAN